MPEILINGAVGRLEARYSHAKDKNAPAELVLHPHPQHGGSMNNKSVYNIYQGLAARGFSVLRLNFRGVGKSQGEYDSGEGELADAAAGLDWLQAVNPHAGKLWVAGFSFGAWIGMQLLMRRPEIGGFLSIAPPANMYDFTFLAPCPNSGLIVHGTQDAIVPEAAVSSMIEKTPLQKGMEIDYRIIEGANHFFTDQLETLAAEIENYLDLAEGIATAPVRSLATA